MRLWQNRIINNESGNIAAFIVNYSILPETHSDISY